MNTQNEILVDYSDNHLRDVALAKDIIPESTMNSIELLWPFF